MSTILIATAILLPFPFLLRAGYALRWYGTRVFLFAWRHACAQVRAGRVFVPLSAALALAITPFSLAHDKPAVLSFIVAACGGTILGWLTPPSILLLGVSGTQSNEILRALMLTVLRARVVHLLSPNPTDPVGLKLDNLLTTSRSHGAGNWQEIVDVYLHMCPLIVINYRCSSDQLDFEIAMIGLRSDCHKAVYLIGPDSNMEMLRMVSVGPLQLCDSTDKLLSMVTARVRGAFGTTCTPRAKRAGPFLLVTFVAAGVGALAQLGALWQLMIWAYPDVNDRGAMAVDLLHQLIWGLATGALVGIVSVGGLWLRPKQEVVAPGCLPGLVSLLSWLVVVPTVWAMNWGHVTRMSLGDAVGAGVVTLMLIIPLALVSYIVTFFLAAILVGILGMPWPDRRDWEHRE